MNARETSRAVAETVRTVTLPFMSFCTMANDGLSSRSAVQWSKGEVSSAAGGWDTGEAGALTKHFDEPFCGLEELERVDAGVLDGHVDERLWVGW